MNRFIGFIILLFFTLALPVFADLEGMVVNVAQNGEITVNRGIADNVTPGTRWYIYRNGAPKAEVEAVLVDNYTTMVRVVSVAGNRHSGILPNNASAVRSCKATKQVISHHRVD